jgi:hypothetical protein
MVTSQYAQEISKEDNKHITKRALKAAKEVETPLLQLGRVGRVGAEQTALVRVNFRHTSM